jgi:hypothetical protein
MGGSSSLWIWVNVVDLSRSGSTKCAVLLQMARSAKSDTIINVILAFWV